MACEGDAPTPAAKTDSAAARPSTAPPSPTPSKAAPATVTLTNGAFDDGKPGLSGWEAEIGATNTGAAPGTKSAAAIVPGVGRNNTAALELSGTGATTDWQMVGQSFPVGAGNQVVVSFAARASNLAQEGAQYVNANAVLLYFDDTGKRLAIEGSVPLRGTSDWQESTLVGALAPTGTTRAKLAFMSSMTGTMWVDDVSVQVRTLGPWAPAEAAAAWDHWVARVTATYPFSPVDTGRAEWVKATASLRSKAVAAVDRARFVEAILESLRPLHDPHVIVTVDGQPKPTVEAHNLPRTWNLEAIRSAASDTIHSESEFAVRRLKSGLGYVLVGSWAKGREPVDRVLAAMDKLPDVRGWIIDARMNQGGNDRWATLLASRFAAKDTVFAKHRFRSGAGYGPWNERTLSPIGTAAPDARPVVVLQSPWCMSSNEGFILMMRSLPTVTTVGLPTKGATRNPAPIYVTSDITISSSRWEAALRDGTLIEGVGIPPDVTVDVPITAYADADPTLTKAIELLAPS